MDARTCIWCPRPRQLPASFKGACCHCCRLSNGKRHGPLCTQRSLAPIALTGTPTGSAHMNGTMRGKLTLTVGDLANGAKLPHALGDTAKSAKLLHTAGNAANLGRAYVVLSGAESPPCLSHIEGVCVFGMPRSNTNTLQAYLEHHFEVGVQPPPLGGRIKVGKFLAWKHRVPSRSCQIPAKWIAICVVKDPAFLLKSFHTAPLVIREKTVVPAEEVVIGKDGMNKWFGRLQVLGHERYRFTDFCSLWNAYAEGYLSTQFSQGRNLLIVRAEDLVYKPLQVIAEISQFGLRRKDTGPRILEGCLSYGSTDRATALKKYVGRNRLKDLSIDIVGKLRAGINSKLMAQLGYQLKWRRKPKGTSPHLQTCRPADHASDRNSSHGKKHRTRFRSFVLATHSAPVQANSVRVPKEITPSRKRLKRKLPADGDDMQVCDGSDDRAAPIFVELN